MKMLKKKRLMGGWVKKFNKYVKKVKKAFEK